MHFVLTITDFEAKHLEWINEQIQEIGLPLGFQGSIGGEVDLSDGPNDDELLEKGFPEKDWVGTSSRLELFFGSEEGASEFQSKMESLAEGNSIQLGFSRIEKREDEDWNRKWKESFRSIQVGEWTISPEWEVDSNLQDNRTIVLNPGAGFGTGTHETTSLCLRALGNHLARNPGLRVLDFGSGSGILAIAAAKLGAEVLAVEIDPDARANADENSTLNGVRLNQTADLKDVKDKFPVIVANILRPVLEEYSSALVERWDFGSPGAILLLSGLLEKDLGPVRAHYESAIAKLSLKGAVSCHVGKEGEWGLLSFCVNN